MIAAFTPNVPTPRRLSKRQQILSYSSIVGVGIGDALLDEDGALGLGTDASRRCGASSAQETTSFVICTLWIMMNHFTKLKTFFIIK